MDPAGQLRNLRDFLLVYNRMTEICFQRCTNNFNYRNLTRDEEHCVDNCAGKLIRTNHRLMGTYVQLMPAMVQRRMEELESKAAEAAKAAEAVGPVEPLAGGLTSSDASYTAITSSLATPGPISAAEQVSTADTNGPMQPAPSLATNEALVSPIPIPLAGERAHTPAAEMSTFPANPSVPIQATLSSAPAGIPLRNVDVNHIGVVNSSISSQAPAHQSTGGEGPPF